MFQKTSTTRNIVVTLCLQVLTAAAFVRAAQVGIYEGAVSLATTGAHAFGVVSGRPIVVGGAPAAQSEHAGVTVAYCGRGRYGTTRC